MNKILMNMMLVAGLISAAGAQAALIQIDGDLADWGLQRNGNANDWIPDANVVPNAKQYAVEDQTGGASTYLNPGWGGQAYDAEALYVSMDSNYLYIALVTGLNPTTKDDLENNTFAPGDFAIDFGRDGSFEFGIKTTGANAGHVYQVTAWDYGIWDADGGEIKKSKKIADQAHPTSIKSGNKIGVGSLVYTSTPFTNMGVYTSDKHYVIEAAIPLSSFAGFSGKFDVHWTMNCNNDWISVDPELTVPEPATLALMPLGLIGLLALRRRKAA